MRPLLEPTLLWVDFAIPKLEPPIFYEFETFWAAFGFLMTLFWFSIARSSNDGSCCYSMICLLYFSIRRGVPWDWLVNRFSTDWVSIVEVLWSSLRSSGLMYGSSLKWQEGWKSLSLSLRSKLLLLKLFYWLSKVSDSRCECIFRSVDWRTDGVFKLF